jgi:hypothetical protein
MRRSALQRISVVALLVAFATLLGPSAVADSSPGAPDAGVPKGESAHSSPTTPEAVLEAIAGVPVKDLTGPVQWVETTSAAYNYGSREGKGLADFPVYALQFSGNFTAPSHIVFDGHLADSAQYTVAHVLVPVSATEDFYGGGGLDNLPRDLSSLGEVHSIDPR